MLWKYIIILNFLRLKKFHTTYLNQLVNITILNSTWAIATLIVIFIDAHMDKKTTFSSMNFRAENTK